MEIYETGVGHLSEDNIRYLVMQGVLVHVNGFPIRDNITRDGDRFIQVYSFYRWVYEDIESALEIIGPEQIVSVMRNGGSDKYPVVASISNYGKQLYASKKAEAKASKGERTNF